MTKTSSRPSLAQLAVECVHCDDQGRPLLRRSVPLMDLLRSLSVTLPVQQTIRADRPGAI